jgi:putative membrane protein
MPFILILASFFLFYFDKKSRAWTVIIFFLSGILGIASFNLGLKEPLLPLFSGLFGASSLITSITKKQKMPKQKIAKLKSIKIKRKSMVQVLVASFIASPLCSFLPGMGSGQAAVIGSEVTGDLDRKEFLILLGAVNTLVMGLSFVALYSIKKARTGTAVFAGKIIPDLTSSDLYFILGAIVLSGVAAFFLTIFLAKLSVKMLSKVNYSKLSIVILLFVSAIVIYFSGFMGFLVYFVSTFLGLTCIFLNIRRTHLMGCLLLPTILYYLL